MKNIFPKEIIENTVEVHRFKHQTRTKVIYAIMILSILFTCASLPFLFMDIYSSAQGILKSDKEKNQITSMHSGKIKTISIEENKYVQQGDTLLTIDNTVGKEKLALLDNQLQEAAKFIHDLKYLTNAIILNLDSLHSFLYQKQYLLYTQKLRELQTRHIKTKKDFIRQQKLYKKEVIARVALENSKYNFELALNKLNHFEKQQRNQWQSELTQQNNKSEELKSSISQFQNEQKNYIITASVSGTIQNIKGFEAGNFIRSGTPIAEISPDTDLIAECYINPSDIGLLKKNNQVKYQINAFNYNQWGMATGKILRISKDITLVNNRPLFRVICSLDQKQLQLKNGFEGKLKKGMTLNARFFIIERSVYELLYDKMDDWFTP